MLPQEIFKKSDPLRFLLWPFRDRSRAVVVVYATWLAEGFFLLFFFCFFFDKTYYCISRNRKTTFVQVIRKSIYI